MSASEKLAWCEFLLIVWGVCLFGLALVALIPGDNASIGSEVIARIAIWATVGYLAVLSWRGAYVAGRKSR